MTEAAAPDALPAQPSVGLAEFLLARYDEVECWAHEASLLDEEAGYVAGGAHWRWTDQHGNPIQLDPLTMAYADEAGEGLLLESVERYRSRSVGEMSQLVIQGAYEVPVAVAEHIRSHDPASVLADLATKRAIVAAYQEACAWHLKAGSAETAESWGARTKLAYICQLLAAPYSQHTDFHPTWALSR